MTLQYYPDTRIVDEVDWMRRVALIRKDDVKQIQTLQNQQSYKSNFRPAFRTLATSYACGSGDYLMIGDTTAGSITVTLPSVTEYAGVVFVFKKISASNNYVIDGGGANIDGSATVTMTANNASRTIQSDGVQWRITSTI